MKKGFFKKGLVLGIIILFVGAGVIPSTGLRINGKSIQPIYKNNILYVGGSGEGNYSSIQNALNDISNGDTVFVYDDSSPYYENFLIMNKSINLIGEDKNTTVIDAGWNPGYVIFISADWVNVSGFTIQHGDNYSFPAIRIASNYNTITDNIISNNGNDGIEFRSFTNGGCNNNIIIANKIINNHPYGINIVDSSNNSIIGNIISNNSRGIAIWKQSNSDVCNNNTIIGNTISGNRDHGIDIIAPNCTIMNNNIISNEGEGLRLRTDNNTVSGNIISDNQIGLGIYADKNAITGNFFFNDGVFVSDLYDYTVGNTVGNNMVNDKPLVFLEDKSDVIIEEDAGQVILINCDNIRVENLTLSNTAVGIELIATSNCFINNNDCSNNIWGIYLRESNNNSITGNNLVSNNKGGLTFMNSGGNSILKNNFMGSKKQIIFFYKSPEVSKNIWSRNYWYRSRLLPKLILGIIIVERPTPPGMPPDFRYFPWFDIDWRPAFLPN